MKVHGLVGALGLLALVSVGHAQTPQKEVPKKKPPPFIMEALKMTPDDFLKRFDKNDDGLLAKEELPPLLMKAFAGADRNGDGMLNREEVGQLLKIARQLLGPPLLGNDPESIVASLLKQFDTDKDGKLSNSEAKGRLADTFARVDQNKDGFLDRMELRFVAQLMLEAKGGLGGGFNNQPDFDSLDKNADGRLTKDELKGTRWLALFEAIDASSDGQLDRREFEAHLRKSAEKKN